MEDDRNIAALYRALMEQEQTPGFNAKTLNVVEDATPLVRRVHGASEATRKVLLREYLQEEGTHALPKSDASEIIKKRFDGSLSFSNHLMTDTATPRKVRCRGHQWESYRFIYCVLNKESASRDHVIRHRCHNRCCINPKHLEIGSQADNKPGDWEFSAQGVDPDYL